MVGCKEVGGGEGREREGAGERQPGKGRSSWLSLPVRLPTSSKHPSKRVLFVNFFSKFLNSHLIKIVAIRKV